MGAKKDPTGEKYNRFTIVELIGRKKCGKKTERIVRVVCECGNQRTGEYRDFKIGRRQSCGCINKERELKIEEGQQFGLWTVIKQGQGYTSPKGNKTRTAICKCKCGVEKDVHLSSLYKGESKSCGCQGRPKKEIKPELQPLDLSEINTQIKGEWKAVDQTYKYAPSGNEQRTVIFQCSCGNKKENKVTENSIGKLYSKCSECLKSDRETLKNLPHKKRLEHILKGMKNRCNLPNNKDYSRYGGKGVGVCEEWKSFYNFYYWAIANGYEEHLTIDRNDSEGNYCPENCSWVTKTYNSRKTSLCILDWSKVAEIRDSKETAKVLAEKYGVAASTIKNVRRYKTWVAEEV